MYRQNRPLKSFNFSSFEIQHLTIHQNLSQNYIFSHFIPHFFFYPSVLIYTNHFFGDELPYNHVFCQKHGCLTMIYLPVNLASLNEARVWWTACVKLHIKVSSVIHILLSSLGIHTYLVRSHNSCIIPHVAVPSYSLSVSTDMNLVGMNFRTISIVYFISMCAINNAPELCRLVSHNVQVLYVLIKRWKNIKVQLKNNETVSSTLRPLQLINKTISYNFLSSAQCPFMSINSATHLLEFTARVRLIMQRHHFTLKGDVRCSITCPLKDYPKLEIMHFHS